MWYEYPIPANFELQKRIIRQLRKWIQGLEDRKLIEGFAFNHYFNLPNEPDTLRIRFDYQNDKNREAVKNELVNEVRQLVSNYALQERKWESPEEGVLEAYEFGSRCAFLFWDLVEKGRFKEDRIFDFVKHKAKIPFNFQFHINHGIMNSLGVIKIPNEQIIHIQALMESTKSKNVQELCEWLKKSIQPTS